MEDARAGQSVVRFAQAIDSEKKWLNDLVNKNTQFDTPNERRNHNAIIWLVAKSIIVLEGQSRTWFFDACANGVEKAHC